MPYLLAACQRFAAPSVLLLDLAMLAGLTLAWTARHIGRAGGPDRRSALTAP